ncbi:MAG: PQQ-binding-like beta-propeller repeat protein, partial [Planctomycetota bacterium]
SLTPAAKAPPVPAEARVAWQVSFPDRALALKPQANGNVAVLTQDGTAAALDPSGKVLWQKTVDCGDDLKHGASVDGNVLVVGAGHHLVAFDGAGKQLLDVPFDFELPGGKGGKKQTSQITAVAVSPDGKNIAAGAANGRLLLLDNQGDTKWTIGGVTGEELEKWAADVKTWEAGKAEREAAMKQFKEAEAQWKEEVKQWEAGGKKGKQPAQPKQPSLPGNPRKPEPVPYLEAAFSSDGSLLLAITKNEGHVLSVADGKISAKVGGIAPFFRPVRMGENLLVTDGRARLELVSPAQGKALSEVRCSQFVQAPGKKPGEMKELPDTAVSAALLNDTLIAATEFDGTVRALKDVKGKLEEQTQWSFKLPLRVTKKLAAGDGLVAVAYWGGTLRVLDSTGAAKFGQTLPQDISALACLGKLVIVATADGRITALEAK